MTMTSDHALRNLFCSTAAQHLHELLKMDKFADLDVPNDFYVAVMKRAERRALQRFSKLKKELKEARDELTEEEEIHHAISGQVEHLGNTHKCRNFAAAFSAYFQYSNDGPLGILCCKSCHCEHPGGVGVHTLGG
jgi:hypothetical protein